jgi:mannose-6-phosphate isomerase-like protein (cupin superfamily)
MDQLFLGFRAFNISSLITSNIKEFAINAGSKMDFATTVNIKNDKSDEVFNLFKSGRMVVTTKISKVTIKPGECVK